MAQGLRNEQPSHLIRIRTGHWRSDLLEQIVESGMAVESGEVGCSLLNPVILVGDGVGIHLCGFSMMRDPTELPSWVYQ